MFFGTIDGQTWCPEREWQAIDYNLSRDNAAILTVAGSLTRFLERMHGMVLQVELQDQYIDQSSADEAAALHCAKSEQILRRKVCLTHRKQLMFDAESVLPIAPLPNTLMLELQDGERPLASLLMDYGLSLSRLDLGITRIVGTCEWQGYWARRSVLRSESGIQALVVEVFHPLFWQRLKMLKQHRSFQRR
ncbi:MAG: chorismate lyase [Mariprofundaceae bacterium]|nr:chorismate lyase [Mariprofundaceae bacterium]